MCRRLVIALRLVENPRIVILDEPITRLDPIRRIEVWKIVQGLAAGRYDDISHHAVFGGAEQFADRISILHEGRIIASGALLELKSCSRKQR
jgi:ABC-2 type transport system ATP-binding protein